MSDRTGAPVDLEAQIVQIAGMTFNDLRAEWRARYGVEPPVRKSADMLRRFLAWRRQEEVHGGMSATAKRRLSSLVEAFARDPNHLPFVNVRLKPGTVLIREWKGVKHRVEVLETGFMHEGKHYASLTEAACAIAGTKWSGPAFFGLRRYSRAPDAEP